MSRSNSAANEWCAEAEPVESNTPAAAIVRMEARFIQGSLESGIVMLRGLLVLVADELDELLIDRQLVAHADRERLRVGLRVVDGHVDLEVAVVGTPPAFDELAFLRQRAAVDVEPAVVAKAGGFDDERIAFPMA